MKIFDISPRLRRNRLVAAGATAMVALSLVACSQSLPTSPTLSPASGSASRNVAAPATEVNLLKLKGSLTGTFTFVPDAPPSQIATVHLDASGVASHLGRFTLTAPHRVDVSTLPARAVGTFELVAANGDRLTGRFEGTGTLTSPPDGFTVVEIYTVTGGTGRFAGATGTFTAERAVNLTTLETTGSLEGTLSSVGSTGS